MPDSFSDPKKKYSRKPEWLRVQMPSASDYSYVKDHLKRFRLHTICESGSCPNQGECWAARTATFMILGNICTRNCRFCNVEKGKPATADPGEPVRIAMAVKELGIKHCVLTSVTRDDLPDGGAGLWAETIVSVKETNPGTTIESLIPDFSGVPAHIQQIIDAGPEVISHNLETVRRLTPLIRRQAIYDRSLEVIRVISHQGLRAKSGLMAGLGETDAEMEEAISDLFEAGCKVLTIGQYLQPSRAHHPVDRYVHPDQFRKYKNFALALGFSEVESAPLVRSSYHAEKHVQK